MRSDHENYAGVDAGKSPDFDFASLRGVLG